MTEQYDQLCQGWKYNYNRGNKLTAMSPPKILTVNEAKISCTTIKKILKPQLYKGVIIQQNTSTEEQLQEKKGELPRHIDEGGSMKTGFVFFYISRFSFLKISALWNYIMKNC